jgi:DNA-binding NarL/FixJ family response regulator
MPRRDGIAATRVTRQEFPDIQVVGLTSVLDDASTLGLLRAEAIAYLLEDTRADDLRRALKAAATGQVELAPKATARLSART